MPVGIALTPILCYYAWRFGGLFGAWVLEAAFLVAFLAIAQRRDIRRVPKLVWVVGAVWSLVALAAVADIQIGNRLYLSTVVYDHYLRTAITDAITRTQIPPYNPQYFLGSRAPLRYHYFWFALCSLVDHVCGNPRLAVNASAVAAGAGLISITALCARFARPQWAGKYARIGVALLCVTGFDLIPVLLRWPRHIDPDMEWWNETIYSWTGAVTWAPHYIAALIAGVTGVLLVHSSTVGSRRSRCIHAAAAGLAFASAVGLNFYLALALAASLLIWLAVLVFQRRPAASVLAAAGLFAALLSAPYLLSLTRDPGSGQPLLSFAVRDFYPLHRFFGAYPPAWARLFALPLNLGMELGLFAAALIWRCKRKSRPVPAGPLETLLWAWVAVSMLLASFLRSGAETGNNDFGSIAPLLAQFALLFWTADFLLAWRTAKRAARLAVAAALALGVAGSLYEIAIDRFYFVLADAGIVPPVLVPDRQMAARAFAGRRFYEALDRVVPRGAVLETNPDRKFDDVFFGLYARRQMSAASMQCGTAFGGDPSACARVIGPLASIFTASPAIAPSAAAGAHALLQSLRIDVLILSDTDAAWDDAATSWGEPAVSSEFQKAFVIPPV